MTPRLSKKLGAEKEETVSSLLHADDFVDTPGSEDAVWVERTVRYLVPRAELGKEDNRFGEDAWAINMTTSALVGEPVERECGKIAIRYGGLHSPGTNIYPSGINRYGKRDEKHRVPGQYCPHCDGGEDV